MTSTDPQLGGHCLLGGEEEGRRAEERTGQERKGEERKGKEREGRWVRGADQSPRHSGCVKERDGKESITV